MQIQPDTTVREPDSLIISTNGYETLKTSDTSDKVLPSLTSLNEVKENKTAMKDDDKEHDSLTSFGESSGYDSFRYKAEEGQDESFAEECFSRSLRKSQRVREYEGDVLIVRSWRATADSIIGPLLSCLLKKAASFLEADVATNCRVTSLISKLASYPTPLLMSLLLCHSFVLQPNVPSLFQILCKLKEEVDAVTEGLDNASELVDKARVFLVQREMALAKPRGLVSDDESGSHTVEASLHVEPKRRSLSSSFSSMFTRRQSATPPSPNIIIMQNTSASPQKRLVFTQEAYWNQSIMLRSILNAVLLDEWLKELAALCEEHALRLASCCEDDSYVRAVGL